MHYDILGEIKVIPKKASPEDRCVMHGFSFLPAQSSDTHIAQLQRECVLADCSGCWGGLLEHRL